jgi:ceramide glucosyltransferase
VRPAGHFFSILTMPLVWAVVALIVRRSPVSLALASTAVVARGAMHFAARPLTRRFAAASRRGRGSVQPLSRGEVGPAQRDRVRGSWLIPLRDALTFFVYVASFFGRRVVWRDRHFGVSADGQLHEATDHHS